MKIEGAFNKTTFSWFLKKFEWFTPLKIDVFLLGLAIALNAPTFYQNFGSTILLGYHSHVLHTAIQYIVLLSNICQTWHYTKYIQ